MVRRVSSSETAQAGDGGGMVVVVSGPSGVGKSTIARALAERLENATLSVSATTRPQGVSEVEGRDYHFLSEDEFVRLVEEGAFLEHAEYAGNRYGTLKRVVDENLARGRLVILEIDVQGGRQVRAARPDAFGLFILPPDESTLLERLRARGRDSEEVIERRCARAKQEIADARASDVYDVYLVNDDLEKAVEDAIEAVSRERSSRR